MRGFGGILAVVWVVTDRSISGRKKLRQPKALEQALEVTKKWPGVIRSDLGVTRKGTEIPCVYAADDLDLHTPKTRVLIVAGFEDEGEAVSTSLQALEWFYTSEEAKAFRETMTVSAVPMLNPDRNPPASFPPNGEAYADKQHPEAEYLWRWIGMQAPDLVVCLSFREQEHWWTPVGDKSAVSWLTVALQKSNSTRPQNGKSTRSPAKSARSLTDALLKIAPCNTGTIPAITAIRKADNPQPVRLLKDLLEGIKQTKFTGPSPARKELQSRVDRQPLQIARQLAKVYGHDLSSVQYIPALALVGRIWLGELTDDPSQRADVKRIVSPYVSDGKPSLPENFGGSHLAGHLIFSELARTANDPDEKAHYLKLVRRAADTGFDAKGEMKEAMPAHSEMSDAVFMGCPILVEAGVQTGERKYIDMAQRHFQFMRERVLRDDGIYRHSPLCETAWGRGNGFPALGVAWSLSALNKDDPAFQVLLKEFQNHMAALVKHQDPTGMWHQVIDDPGSYRELSCTCMITFAMIRGVRSGWLDETRYRPVIDKAFRAIKTRIAADGTLVDVCTGTGKQKTLRDYYDRKAILGRDARGGAMALLVTTEMARLLQESKNERAGE